MKSSLASVVDRMLQSQSVDWPLLARNLQGLRESQTRSESVFGRGVFLRHIPHRIKSTTAAVDDASIAARRCFLCPESLYPEQRGVAFGEEFTIYANPFPILEGHLTMVHRDHRPQRIAGQFKVLLDFAEALPDSFIVYNGPACGASAPDHLHFQASSRDVFPIEHDFISNEYIPRVLRFQGDSAPVLVSHLEHALEILSRVMPAEPEPMVNIAAYHSGTAWTVLVFPRGKHRPRVFETGELTVSPATIDLCGVFVVPVESDFKRMRGSDVESVLSEVTLSDEKFKVVSSLLGEAR